MRRRCIRFCQYFVLVRWVSLRSTQPTIDINFIEMMYYSASHVAVAGFVISGDPIVFRTINYSVHFQFWGKNSIRSSTCGVKQLMVQIVRLLMKWSWRLLVSGFSLLIIAVALLRLTFSCLPWLQQHITAEFSERFNTELSVQSVDADWQGGVPKLSIKGLQLQGKEAQNPGFTIDRFDMELNLRNSLLTRMLVFNNLQVNGVAINLVQDDGARWHLQGIKDIAGSSVGGHQKKSHSPFDWINYQKQVDIRDVRLDLKKKEGKSSLVWNYLTLADIDGQKSLTGRLESSEGYIDLQAKGYGTRPANSQWSGRIKAENLDLAQFCIIWSGCNKRIGTSLVQMDTGLEYRDGYWQVQGQAGIPYLAYQDNYGHWKTVSGHTSLFMESQVGQQWQLWLNDFGVHNSSRGEGALYWKNNLYLKGNIDREYSMTLAAETLDLDKLKQWVLDTDFLPQDAVELITTLNPKGHLENVAVQFFPGRQDFDFDLTATLNKVSVDNWGDAPLAANVSGSLRMGLLNGYFDLDTEHFQLGFPELFRENWTYHTAKARLYWDVVDDYYILKSDDIAMTADEGNLRGKLRLDIPLKDPDAPMDMALTVGITEGDARQTPKYLPVHLPMDEELVEWLDTAIIAADIHSGGFLWNGAIVDSQRSEDSRWGLYFDIDNGELDYGMGDWPRLEKLAARVFVNDDRVEVIGKKARSAGATLKNFSAYVPLDDDMVVKVHGRAYADGETVHHFLTNTPVDKFLDGEARFWRLGGQMSAGLKLELPIEDMDDYKFSLDASVKDFLFSIPGKNIAAEHLTGQLSFSTEEGLNSRALYGSFLGRPAEYSIQTVLNGSELMYTDINWHSRISVPRLQHWLELDWLSLLEGEASYQGRLRLTQDVLDLNVSSDLKGMEIELPAPLAKQPDSSLPLNLRFVSRKQNPEHYDLTARLGDLGQTSIRFTPDFDIEGAAIVLGTGNEPPPVTSNRVTVTGHLPELDVEQWQNRFAGQPGRDEEVDLARQLHIENLLIDRVHYAGYQWDNMKVSFITGDKMMTLSADSEHLAGSLLIPVKPDERYRLDMQRLHLPEVQSDDVQDESYDVLADVNPSLLPDIDVAIQSLVIGDQPMGSLSFRLEKTENGLKVDDLLTSLAGMTLSGFADWVYTGNGHHSWFQGKLKGENLGGLNKAMGFPELVVSDKSDVDINLNWQGSPLNKNFLTMKGGVDIRLEKGRILDAGSGSGALKLFGVLNVDTLRRRMFLDFSDLYSSGISFDELTGDVRFNQGVVTFDKPIVIKGPSSTIRLNGRADANREELDLSMSVTLPVTSNLPILSVLLGTAPPLAGVIYIADKLVGDQVNKLASIHYTITGSFDEPVIALDENFARRAKKQRTPGNNR